MDIAYYLGRPIPKRSIDEDVLRAFQDKARDISSQVRECGGNGLAATIRKALAEAFALGFVYGAGVMSSPEVADEDGEQDDRPYNLALIPPNARTCIQLIALRTEDTDFNAEVSLVFILGDRMLGDGPRTKRWFLYDYSTREPRPITQLMSNRDAFAGLTLSPLVKHDLLRETTNGKYLFFTKRGIATLKKLVALSKAGKTPFDWRR